MKKIIIIFLFVIILSNISCIQIEQTIFGDDITTNELILDNGDYSYMKLNLIKKDVYDKVLCDSDNDGLYSNYYKVNVAISDIYTSIENVTLINKNNGSYGPKAENLEDFNKNLSCEYYINVPEKIISSITDIDEIIMRVYVPLTLDYLIMPEEGNSLGYLSSFYDNSNTIKHNFYPVIDGLVNIYTREYDKNNYKKITTNLDGFKHFDNDLKDKMTEEEFENWLYSVYNKQQDSGLKYNPSNNNPNINSVKNNVGLEEQEEYTNNEGLVVIHSKLKEHSLMDNVQYELFTEVDFMHYDDYFPAQLSYVYAKLNVKKSSQYERIVLENNNIMENYYIVEVELEELYECVNNYEKFYELPSNGKYNSISELNSNLGVSYNIYVNVEQFKLLEAMEEVIIRLFAKGNYNDYLMTLTRTLPVEGSTLATLSNSNNGVSYYDYYPIVNNEVYIYSRIENNELAGNIKTSLDTYNYYFYRNLNNKMTTTEFKNYLEVVYNRMLERKIDYTNPFVNSSVY